MASSPTAALSIRERLGSAKIATLAPQRAAAIDNHGYRALKLRIHGLLLERVDLESMQRLSQERIREELRGLVERLLDEEAVVINDAERRSLTRDIQHEMLGFGPLETLLSDASVSDILVNGHQQVYVERGGRLELTDICFDDDAHLMKIIDKIVSRVGRRIDESSPMVDARLPDGSRVNAIIPPLAIDGPVMSIRRFSVDPLRLADLVAYRSMTAEMAEVLQGLGKAKMNILISGGTGSGKTTMLNVISGFIGNTERIVTVEDAAELQLQQPHVVRLETRPANIEGKGEVSQRALVRNALRMRPDRIILGEVRGAEALDMLGAMNTGHEGSMATIHANTPRDALTRLENMISMAAANLPSKAIRQQISSAVSVVVQVSRLIDGKRKVTSIQEITGMEGEVITMQEIFSFKQTGVAEGGAVVGQFSASGIRPRFLERLNSFGIGVPAALFEPAAAGR
ncbi:MULTISPECIES: CpaF family protein [unclassified Janthinobacterium]|uniref:CpaF family protein n=1 Tax=Janthinobacterium sp. EB271-G4-3-1 TaxID=2775057 RepID=UPI001E49F7F2|nr:MULTISPECIES: CpaF family protein [unclassified Janthinobacterium]MCC7644257.1 CpaF family protein [Janthinobacterium sp. EB271-G4-3-1]MCC7693215.1 CpaF family protein [Janthinobacterium sp. EB271-G4-3-2]